MLADFGATGTLTAVLFGDNSACLALCLAAERCFATLEEFALTAASALALLLAAAFVAASVAAAAFAAFAAAAAVATAAAAFVAEDILSLAGV